MKISKIMFTTLAIILLFSVSLANGAEQKETTKGKGFVSVDNQKTGLSWRFYADKGNRRLPQGFCQKPENGGGAGWRLPSRQDFEGLLADPDFQLPAGLVTEYFSREVRDTFGHEMSPQQVARLDSIYMENSDALVFNLVKKKWSWKFVTNEYNVVCVAPMK